MIERREKRLTDVTGKWIILQHELNQLYSITFYFKISLFRLKDSISQQDRLAIGQAPLKPESAQFHLYYQAQPFFSNTFEYDGRELPSPMNVMHLSRCATRCIYQKKLTGYLDCFWMINDENVPDQS